MSISDDQLVELLLIPGIGRAKARVLYAQGFRSLKDLYECPFEELSEIPGVGTGLASSIKEYAEVMLDVDEKSSDKLETTTGLSMCPMCGSLLAEDAE
ncbi:MAG: helix-hairpin-helix domain-containing protein, partial [Thermoplasmata archaeon]|nr:helix-hairpin-helix domain-containing protein [Thermoplasmata archaeon]